MNAARHWTLSGRVQGVGFRPFVYRLAHHYRLNGWVRNNLGRVEIHGEGEPEQLDAFAQDLLHQAPSIASPSIESTEHIEPEPHSDFRILDSTSSDKADIHVPPDYFICPDCLADMQDTSNRRYQYPFTNCTQCGPRYTLITSLPYDRPNTSMADFPLCGDCQGEYEDPLNRRFHAEPIACPACGPQLQYATPTDTTDGNKAALEQCLYDLDKGRIIAVKGIGGYHLMCDAANDHAIQLLRQRKGRPDKPLAVMFPEQGDNGLALVCEYIALTAAEAELLCSPARPVVLARKGEKSLSALIAPGLKETGIMLPYSPLHHLLLNAFGKPLIATSANLSGEPVLTKEPDVERRLSHITHHFLHHNRPIARPADDSVFRSIDGLPRPLRLGRGYAPRELELPFHLDKPMLACGSHMKNTVALAWGNRLVVSPHIGDLDSLRSMEVFAQTIEDLQVLYQVKAETLVCDAHPNYASSRWATHQGLPLIKVQHHKAHASAVSLEYGITEPMLVFTWDGTGYGDDQSIWGGEAFYGQAGRWKRVASLRPFRLPGGEKAGREPWRSATGLNWETGQEWPDIPVESDVLKAALKQAWGQKINTPQTSSAGRLFDAAASLCGINQYSSFEGQAPMLLEQYCQDLYTTEAYPSAANAEGILVADWAELIQDMQRDDQSAEDKATLFHSRMAHTLLVQAEQLRQQYSFTRIGLSGGVFQNQKLTDYIAAQLRARQFTVCIPQLLPVNDAGISSGQIVEAALQLHTHSEHSLCKTPISP